MEQLLTLYSEVQSTDVRWLWYADGARKFTMGVSNVQQSINSLNALNESLKFEGAEKGFAEVEKASEKVDFDRMTTALETLTGKFSALEVIGMTALVKITDKATIARTAVLLLALTNQLLSAMGKSPLPIESTTVEQLVTASITSIAALIAWWKNNSFTKEAIAADAEYDRLRKRNGK